MNSASDIFTIEFLTLKGNSEPFNNYNFEHITLSPNGITLKPENNVCHVDNAYEMLASDVCYRAQVCMSHICQDASLCDYIYDKGFT